MKKTLAALVVVVLLTGSLAVLRTLRLTAPAPLAAAVSPVPLDAQRLAGRLAQGLRIATVSRRAAEPVDADAFAAFHALLGSLFPRVFAELAVERVGDWSLLIRWPGTDETLAPALLAAHMDVVPIEPGTDASWTLPPFSGAIHDGFVWGRGALDDKSSLMGQLEAVEWLLEHGFAPRRTLYFAYGHDEEVGGSQGAARIAGLLKQRGVRLAFTLDEGSAVTRGIVPGVSQPVAAVMAGEKGYVTFRLTTRATGGHSSMPRPDGAIARLARGLARLDARHLPARLTPPVAAMLARLAPSMPFAQRLAIANRDLLEPLLLRALARGNITDAMIRSTQAITVVHAGVKDNVLPSEAYALVNYRLLPGDHIEDVARHIAQSVDDPGIEVTQEDGFGNEAPPLSDPSAPAFAIIERTVNEVFPEALVSTGLVMATTDNRYYAPVREQGYHFVPFPYAPDDQSRVHGTDERVGVDAYADMVRFYIRLLQNTAT